MFCNLIKEKLHYVDITKIKEQYSHLPNNPFLMNLDLCTYNDIKRLSKFTTPLKLINQQEYSDLWEKWKNSQADIRTIDENYQIIEGHKSYFDNFIISKTDYIWNSTSQVVNKIVKSNLDLDEDFVSERITELIKNKNLLSLKMLNDEIMKSISNSESLYNDPILSKLLLIKKA